MSQETTREPSSSGKVRDIYDLGDRLLLVASDRISAFDVILPNAIPIKGQVLTALSAFWFGRTTHIVDNHVISTEVEDFPGELSDEYFVGRSMLVRKARVVPVECVVRGYLAGSAWAEYRETGAVAGHELPAGMAESDRLPQAIFTPATKAAVGKHDENITKERMAELVGEELAHELETTSLAIYRFACVFAEARGIIIADTKFEFGLVDSDRVVLIDELLTPDSSRFWPEAGYEPGKTQPSFDKQYVRDWLDSVGWDREPPAPVLPPEVVKETSRKYLEAYERLTGQELPFLKR